MDQSPATSTHVIDGVYVLRKKIGQGGMATVYLADVDLTTFNYTYLYAYTQVQGKTHTERLHKAEAMAAELRSKTLDVGTMRSILEVHRIPVPPAQVAVKVATGEDNVQRFEGEWKNLLCLNHENLVKVYGGGIYSKRPYYAMELLRNIVSPERITEEFTIREKLDVIVQAGRGLQYLHDNGLIHRDIKPANMVTCEAAPGQYVTKVTDLGLAKSTEEDLGLTKSGAVMGSPCYMSPEQVASTKNADHRSDIYSLGASLYELVTGVKPYHDKTTVYEIISAISMGTAPIPPRKHIPDLPGAVAAITECAMARNPRHRYAKVSDMIADIERYLAEESPALTASVSLSAADKPKSDAKVGAGRYTFEKLGDRKGVWKRERTGAVLSDVDHEASTVVMPADGAKYREPRELFRRLTSGPVAAGIGVVVLLLLVWLAWPSGGGRGARTTGQQTTTQRPGVGTKTGTGVTGQATVTEKGKPTGPKTGPAPSQTKVPTTKAELDRALKAKNPDYTGQGKFKIETGRIVEAELGSASVTDLSPLAGLPLRRLSLAHDPVEDLSPLKGMPLESLDLWDAREVADLSPLTGMPIKELFAHETKVADLRPLVGCPLDHLWVYSTPVTDITPLAKMPTLKDVAITPANIQRGLDDLRRMGDVETICVSYRERYKAPEFWYLHDARAFGKPGDLRPVDGVIRMWKMVTFGLEHGRPLLESLQYAKGALAGTALEQPIARIMAEIQAGKTLSQALRGFPDLFTPALIAGVDAGEKAGQLDKALIRVLDDWNKAVVPQPQPDPRWAEGCVLALTMDAAEKGADGVSRAPDSSPKGQEVKIRGVQTMSDPERGPCYRFSAAPQDGMWCDSPDLDLRADFTIALWIMADADQRPDAWPTLVQRCDWDGKRGYALGMLSQAFGPVPKDAVSFMLFDPDGSQRTAANTKRLADGKWHHLTAVFAGDRLGLYVDGLREGSAEFVKRVELRPAENQPFTVGVPGPGLGKGNYKGLMDDLAVWRVALTPEDVKALHRYSKAGKSYCQAIGAARQDAAGAPRVPAGFRAAKNAKAEPYTHSGWAQTAVHEATGIEMVYIPAGEFVMGSPPTEVGRDRGEVQHQVKLTRGFYLGKYEVTQGQWEKVMGNNPSGFKNAGMEAPVEQVSWDDCQAFMAKLSRTPNAGAFRLPTEAEWEYACRGGKTTALNSGKEVTTVDGVCRNLDDVAWYSRNSGGTTHPVGQKPPNAWGLHDMHGNVFEWCSEWSGDYPAGPVTDPTGPAAGKGRLRRGGAWSTDVKYGRAAFRDWGSPGERMDALGFRLAFTLPAVAIRAEVTPDPKWAEGCVLALDMSRDAIYEKEKERFLHDLSGKGNDARILGPTTAPGPVGDAMSFQKQRDHLLVADNDSLDPTDAVSVAAWVNRDPGSETFAQVLNKDRGTAYALSIPFGPNTGTRPFLEVPGGNLVRANTAPPDNQWYHVVGTYDGKQIIIYFNGQKDGTQEWNTRMTPNKSALLIGTHPGLKPGEGSFKGLIDEVAVWNRALTPDEIKAVYGYSKAGKSYCQAIGQVRAQAQAGDIPEAELAAALTDKPPARIGPYRVVKLENQDATGRVYRVVDEVNHRDAVLSVMPTDKLRQEDAPKMIAAWRSHPLFLDAKIGPRFGYLVFGIASQTQKPPEH